VSLLSEVKPYACCRWFYNRFSVGERRQIGVGASGGPVRRRREQRCI